MARPLPEILGTIVPEQIDRLKSQISKSVISVFQSEEMMTSVSAYLTDTLDKLHPHSLDAIMQTLYPESEEKLKAMLSGGLLDILSRKETSAIINSFLSQQIERLLATPIGRLSDHISEKKLRDAIREFDVGGVVREKIRNYPAEKLEALVLSVAKEQLRTIELFGALFGLIIGIAQAVQFYIYAR